MATRVGATGLAANPNSENFYKRLGVSKFATQDEIRIAYKKLALRYHPDKNSDTTRDAAEIAFKNIGEAYETLYHPAKKAEYDKKLFQPEDPFKSPFCPDFARNHPAFRDRFPTSPYQDNSAAQPSPTQTQPKGLNFIEKENDIKMDMGFHIGAFLSKFISNPKSNIPPIDYISAKDLGLNSYDGLRFESGPRFLGARLDIYTRSNHDDCLSLYESIRLKYTKEIKVSNLFTKGGYDTIVRRGTIEVCLEKKDFGLYLEMLAELFC